LRCPHSVVGERVVAEESVLFAHRVRDREADVLPVQYAVVGEHTARDSHGLETKRHVAFSVLNHVVSHGAEVRVVERDPVIYFVALDQGHVAIAPRFNTKTFGVHS
jgi:hypothetical protein